MSIGITRSNIPIGTIGRDDPFVLVVKMYESGRKSRDTKTGRIEKRRRPGVAQPMNSRSLPS